ncbi:MAG TPA: polyribonucleotide nucleotidyltransferase [Elusimicrobiota bacterium]|nr:polyribonucleotide nucleotidyltransferase [Elusimicrobiota bacterium]
MTTSVERMEVSIGDKKISWEAGRVAKQANGAALVRMGDTMVLVAVACGKTPKEGADFIPLTVDYRERTYAAGRIPGGFFKREGRARPKEILTSRLIDRGIRPLFPETIRQEIHVAPIVLCTDQSHDTDIPAILGASVALGMSDIPWNGPLAAVRIGRVRDEAGAEKFVVNPTLQEQAESLLDLVVAGKKDALMMVESGSHELSEETLIEALQLAQAEINKLCDAQEEFFKKCRKPKFTIATPAVDAELAKKIDALAREQIRAAVRNPEKSARENAIDEIKKDIKAKVIETCPEGEALVGSIVENVLYEEARKLILDEKRRTDGRAYNEIRPISIELGVLPRTHGSALFTRGQTQALATVTLGSPSDKQIMDELEGEYKERFLMHYNFPGFSTGEPKGDRGPGRREIGHGALARRALLPLIPTEDSFPYTIRIVSDILESNGSSSMASVCGGSLALFDAGVPSKSACAGVAMGLIKEGDRIAILTDIMGMEDHLGDMDFKVAGTRGGINALQMDIKIEGVTVEIMKQALQQAKEARLFILDKMEAAIQAPRTDLSQYAPRISILSIPVDKIGALIGPGGKNIRKIIEETGANVDVEDDGKVFVTSDNPEAMEAARWMVESCTAEIEVGKIYKGRVTRIMPRLGAFVEVLPGKEGLVHVSQLDVQHVERVEDVVKEGDTIEVKCIEIDNQGRVNLSRRAVIKPGSELEVKRPERREFDRDRGRDRGGFRRDRDHRGPRR